MSARKTPPSKNHPPAGFRHPVVSEFGQYMRRWRFLGARRETSLSS